MGNRAQKSKAKYKYRKTSPEIQNNDIASHALVRHDIAKFGTSHAIIVQRQKQWRVRHNLWTIRMMVNKATKGDITEHYLCRTTNV